MNHFHYGTLYCTADGSKRSGYYEDRPREDQKFVLHCEPEQGVVMLPRIFQVARVPGSIQEARAKGTEPMGADTEPGDWVFFTPFSRYVLREYHKQQPDGA